MTTNQRRLVLWALAFASVAGIGGARRVSAFSGGITSPSFSAVGGCNDCHLGGTIPTVTLTGPNSVDPDSTHEYTLTVSDVAATQGAWG